MIMSRSVSSRQTELRPALSLMARIVGQAHRVRFDTRAPGVVPYILVQEAETGRRCMMPTAGHFPCSPNG